MSVKYQITDLQKYAEQHNGKLVSTKYISVRSNLIWECKNNHSWKMSWDIAKRGIWCPFCTTKKIIDVSTLQNHALNKGGKLLSSSFANAKTQLTWQCEKKHVWKSAWSNVRRGGWCPECSNLKKPNILLLQKYASERGGKLLSLKYKNAKTRMLWQCSKNHSWKTTWDAISGGNTWCPECSSFKTEKLCKSLLESKLKIMLPKIRFTYNDKQYEFDGYNEEHKIAFEYHGIQHYKYPNFWHKTEDIFIKAQQRDKEKEQYCIDNGIKLIVIPYNITDIKTHISNLII